MGKKLDSKTTALLIKEFNEKIIPWCKANNFSLYSALEESKKDPEKERILHTLYKSNMNYYVYSAFKNNKHFGEKYPAKILKQPTRPNTARSGLVVRIYQ